MDIQQVTHFHRTLAGILLATAKSLSKIKTNNSARGEGLNQGFQPHAQTQPSSFFFFKKKDSSFCLL